MRACVLVVALVFVLQLPLSAAQTDDSAKPPATETKRPESDAGDSTDQKPSPESAPPTLDQAAGEAMQVFRQHGGAEAANQLELMRQQYLAQADYDERADTMSVVRLLIAVTKKLSDGHELLTARRLGKMAVALIEPYKDTAPDEWVLANDALAQREIDFEEYPAALARLNAVLLVLENNPALGRTAWVRLSGGKARVLRKMRKFPEAEEILLALETEMKADPEKWVAELPCLRFAFLRLYCDMDDAKKFEARLNETSNSGIDRVEAHCLTIITIRSLLGANKPDEAAEAGQKSLEFSQKHFGVQSLEYVESLEAMFTAREAQGRYTDAADLLTKSAEIRGSLLGKDHRSVARVNREVERLRKRLLSDAGPLWKPPEELLDSKETADRYGESTSPTVKEP